MHGSNCGNCLFSISLTIEGKVTFLKNGNIYDDISTLTQPPLVFVFLFLLLLLKEYACTDYGSSKPSREAVVLSLNKDFEAIYMYEYLIHTDSGRCVSNPDSLMLLLCN